MPGKNVSYSYLNRELSWLQFNQRVFAEAREACKPLLERVKFLSITASNLDEFYMIRVGSLRRQQLEKGHVVDISGMTAAEQLRAIDLQVRKVMAAMYELWRELELGMARQGLLRLMNVEQLNEEDHLFLQDLFADRVWPVLTPAAVEAEWPFPQLSNLGVQLAVKLAPSHEGGQSRWAIVPLPEVLPRQVILPAAENREVRYLMLEDLVRIFINELFPGEEIQGTCAFRITRDGDVTIDEELSDNLSEDVWKVVRSRKMTPCVRMEIEADASMEMVEFLRQALALEEGDVFQVPGLLDLSVTMQMTSWPGFDELRLPPWKPQPPLAAELKDGMFAAIASQDILLVHPYEDFAPVMSLLQEAAVDPGVLAIKITLYRTSGNSPIVAALCRAAQLGKSVTVLVEAKARFDERNNLENGSRLLESGAQVLFGVKGFKTHAKVCLVIRDEPDGIRRYLHFGTGNYNEVTAAIYSDVSYFTCRPDYGREVSAFFHAVTGYSSLQQLQILSMSPGGIRLRLLQLIQAESDASSADSPGLIMAKLNSLTDRKLINALYDASGRHVEVKLNVRGLCCLRPGQPKLSENISVVSIVDRFLEHARIIYFRHGGQDLVFISSADWMERNLDRRVELLVPVFDGAAKERLINMLQLYCTPNLRKTRWLQAAGSWQETKIEPGQMSVQQMLCEQARKAKRRARQRRVDDLQPIQLKKGE